MATRDALASLIALQRALPLLAERAMLQAMRQAEAVAQQTRAFNNRTGRLRASIRGGVLEANALHVVGALTAGADDAQPARGEDWAAPSNEYAPKIELGTGRSSPRPFILPAMLQIAAEDTLRQAVRTHFHRWSP